MNKAMLGRKKYMLLFGITSICFISMIFFRCLNILGGITDKFFFLLCIFMLLLLNYMRTKEMSDFAENRDLDVSPYSKALLLTILVGDVAYILSIFYEFKSKVM